VTDNVKGHIALDVDVVGGVDGYRLGSYGCFPMTIPSGDVNIAIENVKKKSWISPLNIVIVHSYVNVYQSKIQRWARWVRYWLDG